MTTYPDGKEDRFHDEPKIGFKDFAPEAVNFVQALDDEFLDCRVYRHNWQIGDADSVMATGPFQGSRVRLLNCDRCGTARADFLTPVVGKVWYRKYFYPDSYTFSGARTVGGLDRDLVLMERTVRQPVGTSQPEDPELRLWLAAIIEKLTTEGGL